MSEIRVCVPRGVQEPALHAGRRRRAGARRGCERGDFLRGERLGVAAAFGASRVLAKLLYGVKPRDPFTYAAAAGCLRAIEMLARYVPARRAMRVDPMVA